MKSIDEYCNQNVLGWYKLPAFSGINDEKFTSGFLCPEKGLHLLATRKKYGVLDILHLSIAPMRSIKELTDSEWEELIVESASDIAQLFFPGRNWLRQPDDSRNPHVKHYFSILEENE